MNKDLIAYINDCIFSLYDKNDKDKLNKVLKKLDIILKTL